MDLGLGGKRALVTGASRGIGRAIAGALAAEGVRVALVARTANDVEAAAAGIRERGDSAIAIARDVSDEPGASATVAEAIERLGGLDILVNNVGGSMSTGGFASVDAQAFRAVVDRNLMAVVYPSIAAVAHMKDHGGGVIVHIGSINGRELGASSPYTAAKAAITGLAKEMGTSLAPLGIRVCAVSPGSILFPGGSWDRRLQTRPERIAKMVAEELPFGRFGTVEEVADVVTFLCSKRASWVAGSTVVVDGSQGRAF